MYSGLNITSLCKQNHLYVLADDGSHHQDKHGNIKSKYLQLRWLVEMTNFTNLVLYNIYIYKHKKFAASGKKIYENYKKYTFL
jgi:hypothetical protein